ncbi:uncharacterized membrane protein YjgN (DUF898 family) [Chelatococcus caeni]|uniref:Uncharacterized membrane protein YjgN (DUF898 family) n=1 Tax=Chelatococcus caeni TaxID=1348468 RepID=A0A840BZH6_9HYPH|nr:YjgN family protein [Chelatococcus caeni]MBB4015657.1 uncharacterized membrane protein YjgN (DUF898 family) [Chelatococcus caeni]
MPRAAAMPAGGRIEQFTFAGSAREYFGIWIVNVLLTIVTLGIYSAWAKVRRMRYFYGSTRLAGSSFDYHARPVKILIGRIIVVTAIVIYNVLANLAPLAGLAVSLVLLPVVPWLLQRGLRFNARVTSFRNVRFDFAGGYWGAARAFVLGPVIAVLSLGILAPVTSRWLWRYVVGNLRYGGRGVACEPSVRALYRQWWLPALLVVCGLVLVAGGVVALKASSLLQAMGYDDLRRVLSVIIPIGIVAYLVLFYGTAGLVYHAGVRNVALGATVLDGQHRFRSTLSRGRYAFIAITNLLATVFSLGLARPWAAVRMARYNAAATALVVAGSLDDYLSGIVVSGSAVGAEFMDVEGFDFAL